MKNRELVRKKQHLDDLSQKIAVFSEDQKLQSEWAKYLCIVVSGFLENSVRILYSEYAKNKSSPSVANFVEAKLKDFQNPKMQKILDLAGLFSQQWKEELNNMATEVKDAVDSIANNRNKIAHGEDVGITYSRIKEYYQRALKVVEFIENQCNPSETGK
jgi:hypothetical protein